MLWLYPLMSGDVSHCGESAPKRLTYESKLILIIPQAWDFQEQAGPHSSSYTSSIFYLLRLKSTTFCSASPSFKSSQASASSSSPLRCWRGWWHTAEDAEDPEDGDDIISDHDNDDHGAWDLNKNIKISFFSGVQICASTRVLLRQSPPR